MTPGIRRFSVPKKPRTGRSKLGKRLLYTGLAIGTLGLGHLSMQGIAGRSYPKRIPIAGRAFSDGHRFDFFFGKHLGTSDLSTIRRGIKQAEAEGYKYNVLVLESGNRTEAERHGLETQYNTLVGLIRQINGNIENEEARLRRVESELKGSGGKKSNTLQTEREQLTRNLEYRRKVLNGLEATERGESETSERKHAQGDVNVGFQGFNIGCVRLAAENGLHIKMGEGGTFEEANVGISQAKRMQELIGGDKASSREWVATTAEHIRHRDPIIARTLVQVGQELEEHPDFRGKPIRAIVALGPGHIGSARLFDRQTFSTVTTASAGDPFAGSGGDAAKLATALAQKGPKAIQKFREGK